MTTSNLIDTTFTAKNMSSAVSVYEYTATGTMRLRFQVRLYQVAGGGDYTINLRLNDGDAQADDPVVPKTTYTAAAGAQNIWLVSNDIDVLVDDVINVMVLGQSGDTAVTGSIRIFTDDNIATLADDAITSAKYDESTAFPVKLADTGSTKIARTGADSDTLETLSDQLDTVDAGNGGALSLTYTVNKAGGGVLEGATVKLYSDSDRATLVNAKVTDVLGQVTFTNLVAGPYYLTTTASGYSDMLDSEVVS